MTKEEFLALKEGDTVINKYSGNKFCVTMITTWSMSAKEIGRNNTVYLEIGPTMQYYDV
ncbi:hypothetical protein AGMMS49965_07350 [Bacteroidia bacterium]|nr:hypothetical protein AGMMS49965_07350 [Bacteroidia bacterium]